MTLRRTLLSVLGVSAFIGSSRAVAQSQRNTIPALAEGISKLTAGLENRLQYSKQGHFDRESLAVSTLRALAAVQTLQNKGTVSNAAMSAMHELATEVRNAGNGLDLMGTNPEALKQSKQSIDQITARLTAMI